LPRLVAPILVFVMLLGIGTYLTLTLVPPDDHQTKAIVMACVGIGAALIYCFLAYRAGLFKRSKY
jgi:putative flippase GtrA